MNAMRNILSENLILKNFSWRDSSYVSRITPKLSHKPWMVLSEERIMTVDSEMIRLINQLGTMRMIADATPNAVPPGFVVMPIIIVVAL